MVAADIRNLADEEVMQLVGEGSPRAFELLYDRHGGAAFSLAYRMVGDRVAAEDISQEAFLSIWRSRLRYDSARGSVRTWVLGIVHNRAIDALRRGASCTSAGASSWTASRSATRRPSGRTSRPPAARRRAACAARSTRLPHEQRRTIELAYFGGFSHSQIAELLDEPIGTVKGRMRLGLDKLRRQLAEFAAGESHEPPTTATYQDERRRLHARRAHRPGARRPSSATWPAARSAATSWSACVRPPMRCRARSSRSSRRPSLKAR